MAEKMDVFSTKSTSDTSVHPNPYMLPAIRKQQPRISVPLSAARISLIPGSGTQASVDTSLMVSLSRKSSSQGSNSMIGKMNPFETIPIRREDLTAVYTLFRPTPEFAGKVDLTTKHLSLDWLFEKPAIRPEQMLTLDNLPTDLFMGQEDASGRAKLERDRKVLLNSPRSIIALLRSGVTVEDLQERPFHDVEVEGRLSGKPKHVVELRHTHREARRQALVHRLRRHYDNYKKELSLDEIIAFFDSYERLSPGLLSGDLVQEPTARSPTSSHQPPQAHSPSPSSQYSPFSDGLGSSQASPTMSEQKPAIENERRVEEGSHGVELDEGAAVISSPPQEDGGEGKEEVDTQLIQIEVRPSTPVPPVNLLVTKASVPKNSDMLGSHLPGGPAVTGSESPMLSKRSNVSLSPSANAALSTSRTTVSKLSKALVSLGSIDSSLAEWGNRKITETAARMDNLLSKTLSVRERTSLMHRETLQRSLANELACARRLEDRKQVEKELQWQKSEKLRLEAQKHKLMAAQKIQEVNERRQKEIARNEEHDRRRQESIRKMKEHKRLIAESNSKRRSDKVERLRQTNVDMEEQRIIDSVTREIEWAERTAKIETERKLKQQQLKLDSKQRDAQRDKVHQQASLLQMGHRMVVEHECEMTKHRLAAFLQEKAQQDALKRAERREKREAITRTAEERAQYQQQLKWEKVQKSLNHFESKYHELYEERVHHLETQSEVSNLKWEDKDAFKSRRVQARQYEVLCMLDGLQRKTGLIDKTAATKKEVLTSLRAAMEERGRDKVRILQTLQKEEIAQDKQDTFASVNGATAGMSSPKSLNGSAMLSPKSSFSSR